MCNSFVDRISRSYNLVQAPPRHKISRSPEETLHVGIAIMDLNVDVHRWFVCRKGKTNDVKNTQKTFLNIRCGSPTARLPFVTMFSSHLLLVAPLVSPSFKLGALLNDPSQLKSVYDFIIVGGELPAEIHRLTTN